MTERADIESIDLYVETRGQIVDVYRFTEGRVTVGRHATAHIKLDSPEVSRHHARLKLADSVLTIEDLKSSSGTLLNGDQLPPDKPAEVPPGAVLTLGTFVIYVGLAAAKPAVDLPPVQVIDKPSADKTLRLGFTADKPTLPPPPNHNPSLRSVAAAAMKGKPTDAQAPPRSGELLSESSLEALSSRYKVRGLLGKGGMGEVFLVQEQLSKRIVALKVLRADVAHNPEVVRQFVLEGIIAARLQHPNVLPVYDVGYLEQDFLYYTMRYVEGPSVEDLLEAMSLKEQIRAVAVIAQAASAVAAAHQQNLMHLDLKPGNLLVDQNNHCYVMDWGLVSQIPGKEYKFEVPNIVVPREKLPAHRASLGSLTEDTLITFILNDSGSTRLEIAGTERYMAPEQARGRPAAMSDLWSLGLMLYKALTGVHPYKLLSKGNDELVVPEIAAIERIPPAADTAAKRGRELAAPELGPICDRALRQAQPSFDSVEDFADELWQALKDPVRAAGASAAQAPNAEADRRRMVILARLAALPFYAVFERRRLLEQLRALD